MSPDSIISLPKGGGALQGIGEKFSPDLHTGTGNLTVPIAIPPGRNGFQPKLSLSYSTGNGNGPFGLGWKLSIPGVARKTSLGIPRYNEPSSGDEDVFVLSGVDDLVPVGFSDTDPSRRRYRPRTEGLFAQIERQFDTRNDFWEVKTSDGLITTYGTRRARGNDTAVIAKPPQTTAKVFAWKLTETQDPFGNRIRYVYSRASGRVPAANPEFFEHQWDQPLLAKILYADYGHPAVSTFLVSITFAYEERPDPFSDYRAGFEIRTSKRCSRIVIATHAGQDRLVREYRLQYSNTALNRVSHLKQIDIIGFDDSGGPSAAFPPLAFEYTGFEPHLREFAPVTGDDLPAALTSAATQLVDLHGAGLPDIIEMNGTVRYWRNLGGNRFDVPRTMQFAPAHALGDPGVQLLDANGDGRADLMVTSGGLAGYYPLKFDPLRPSWDSKSFQAFEHAPGFSLDDIEVKLIDLDGDGITDAIRSDSRFHNFFNHAERKRAWKETTTSVRRQIDVFPDVSFSDPRVRLADMTGDGLQDIVLIYDRNVEYWPNLGYGNWGSRIHMRQSPRLPVGANPRQVLVGDVDGDGVADLIYVDDGKIHLWVNQSGNGWSEPMTVSGTPGMNDLTTVRLLDLNGSGTAGILWITNASVSGRYQMFFLDLTVGVKPYLLSAMNNHTGGVTRIEYAPSTRFYLADLSNPKTRWKTPLPFPVQVVSRVEVIDDISGGRVATRYRYHHGYWDGAEREFNGFGMVEKLDSEIFEVKEVYFSPPTLTRTWFHQGAVGDEYGDWSELSLSHEYWEEDPELLDHTQSINGFLTAFSRRARRDALRSLRGSILRTELYGLDGNEKLQARPYTVSEYSFGLREESPPDNQTDRERIFFPFLTAQRVSQWERGSDPLTLFQFSDDYDDAGHARKHATVATPRRSLTRAQWTVAVDRQMSPDESRILATHTRMSYATPDAGFYIRDRVCDAKTFELADPRGPSHYNMTSSTELLRKQFEDSNAVRSRFFTPNTEAEFQQAGLNLTGHKVSHYDGEPFMGLPAGRAGRFGALTRTETLAFRDQELEAAYVDGGSSRRPEYLGGALALPSGAPANFGTASGYQSESADGVHLKGYYVNTTRHQYDFQVPNSREQRGLLSARLDALGNRTTVVPDSFWILPAEVTDAAGLKMNATYNYRVFQPASTIDINGNVSEFKFSANGLLTEIWLKGKPAKNEGDRGHPSLSLTYDFFAYRNTENLPRNRRIPTFVHSTRRIWHDSDSNAPATTPHDVIESRQYSDGFGRLIQTRDQAEDWTFGDTGDDVGLAESQGVAGRPAIALKADDRVTVSGWQIYDNKGRVVEKCEPFFDRGWAFQYETDATRGLATQYFYDPRGKLIRTINTDGSEQRVALGRVTDLTRPDDFVPTPWESFSYDTNDLAVITNAPDGSSLTGKAPASHHFTPIAFLVDAFGRRIAQLACNAPNSASWLATQSSYDTRGNVLSTNDALGRAAFNYRWDLLNRLLRIDNIDSGLRTSVVDAMGKPVEHRDSRGSVTLREYDRLNRLTRVWARNQTSGALTLREEIAFGDEGDRGLAADKNLLGRAVEHRDEAGILRFSARDFKGNLLDKTRQVISDQALQSGWEPDWSRTNAATAVDNTVYQTTISYDALNRVSSLTYPTDVQGNRSVMSTTYARSGQLESVALDDTAYVERIAYNAKSQRVLIIHGNGIATRYVYAPETFRLARSRSESILSPPTVSRADAFRNGQAGDEVRLQFGGRVRQDFAYTYDLAGNVTAINEQLPDCGIANTPLGRDRLQRQFEYDPLYRLTSATGRACSDIGSPRPLEDLLRCGAFVGGAPTTTQDNAPDQTEGYKESYSYDPAGNMLELRYQSQTAVWKRQFGLDGQLPDQWLNAGNNRLTGIFDGATTRTCQVDPNGNLFQQDTNSFHTWDQADRMIGYRVQPQGSAAPSLQAQYLYGADGIRVKKFVRNQQGQVNSAVYIDSVFEHHSHTDPSGKRENNTLHVLDDKKRVAFVRVGQPLDTRDVSPRVRYQLGDHLCNNHVVVGGTDARSGTFISREEFFPFGETSYGGFAKKQYRFAGKERDEESGLCYFGARYFAPTFARWISCDPAGGIDASNLYVYTRQNPVTHTDFTGYQSDPEPDPTPEEIAESIHEESLTPEELAEALENQRRAWAEAVDNVQREMANDPRGEEVREANECQKQIERRIGRLERLLQRARQLNGPTPEQTAAGQAEAEALAPESEHTVEELTEAAEELDRHIRNEEGGGRGGGNRGGGNRGPLGFATPEVMITTAGMCLTAYSLYKTDEALSAALERSVEADSIKPLKDETIRQGAGWGAGLTASVVAGEVIGGPPGAVAGLVVGGVAGMMGYNVADSLIAFNDWIESDKPIQTMQFLMTGAPPGMAWTPF